MGNVGQTSGRQENSGQDPGSGWTREGMPWKRLTAWRQAGGHDGTGGGGSWQRFDECIDSGCDFTLNGGA